MKNNLYLIVGEDQELVNFYLNKIMNEIGLDEDKKINYDMNTSSISDILDEVSMVGLELFWSLLQAIPLGAKLIMLGDNGQLPPIGVGNLLNDLMNSGKINLVNLTKIHRQAEKSAIITKSQAIRRKEFLLSCQK